jgi:hypothetical protein
MKQTITAKKISIKLNKMWQTASDNSPAFKEKGQTQFTWENYYKLRDQAEQFSHAEFISADRVRNTIDEFFSDRDSLSEIDEKATKETLLKEIGL